jgi:hypothetical protein
MSRGVRAADWAQRAATGVLVAATCYLAFKVTQGGSIVKHKIEGEQQERMQRMESDLKKWAAEDAAKDASSKKD